MNACPTCRHWKATTTKAEATAGLMRFGYCLRLRDTRPRVCEDDWCPHHERLTAKAR